MLSLLNYNKRVDQRLVKYFNEHVHAGQNKHELCMYRPDVLVRGKRKLGRTIHQTPSEQFSVINS